MTDREKFECFKKEKLEENERLYGAELRERYGEDAVEAQNRHFGALGEDAYREMEALGKEILDGLAAAVHAGEQPSGGEARRLASEEAAGRSVSTLWLGGRSFVLPIGRARAILDKVEMYAADCFDVTAAHKAAVESLESIAAVDAYDYTAGYPERLTLTTREEAGDE